MNKEIAGTILGFVFLAIGALLGTLVAVLIRAWALVWMWDWFAEPFGIMSLTFWHAAGLSLLVAFLTYELNSYDGDEPGKEATIGLVKSIFFSLSTVGIGFIYQLLM